MDKNLYRLIGSFQFLFTRLQRGALPLEASKSLVSYYFRKIDKELANTILERTKKHIDLWIEDDTIKQVLKRYFNYLINSENLTLSESFSPFVLISCWKVFRDIFEGSGNLYEEIRRFFLNLDTESIIRERDYKNLFLKVFSEVNIKNYGIPLASHISFMINPRIFVPITPSAAKRLVLITPDSYFNFISGCLENGIKPLEMYSLLLNMFEDFPSKQKVIENITGYSIKKELVRLAEKLWNEKRFYEAHEVLEDVWCLEEDKEKREAYQGVIRFAIALYHIQSGEREKGKRVLKKSINQLRSCSASIDIDVEHLIRCGENILESLESKKTLDTFPDLKVI